MRKGVILVVIIGIVLIISTLALAALFLMAQESRIAEHKIKRTKAFFAAQAGMVLALEQLRKGVWSPSTTQKYCLNDNIGNDCTPNFRTVDDTDIPYDVTIEIFPVGATIPGSSQIDIVVNY